MRLKIAGLRRVIKADLRIEFVHQNLTSYGGLELVRRYFRLLGLQRRLRQAFSAYGLGGDYGCGRLVLLVVALFLVGARRLEHVRYVAHDPLFTRLCGLARIPSDRTVVNWLKQFTQEALQAVITLNSTLLYEQIERLGLSRLTIDVDGTVIRTGNKVASAFRGFNPHHRKDPSYYPLLAHLAQTGCAMGSWAGAACPSTGAYVKLGEAASRAPSAIPCLCWLRSWVAGDPSRAGSWVRSFWSSGGASVKRRGVGQMARAAPRATGLPA